MHLAPLLLVALCASLCAGFSTRDEYRSAYAQALSKIDWVSVKKVCFLDLAFHVLLCDDFVYFGQAQQ